MIKVQRKYEPLTKAESRYFIVTGGRASGKSFNVSVLLLLMTFETDHVILFTRYTLTSASISIIPEFLEKIELLGLESEFYITKDEMINKNTGARSYSRGSRPVQGIRQQVLNLSRELPPGY